MAAGHLSRRAPFGALPFAAALAATPVIAASPPRLSEWERMAVMADQLGDRAIIRVIAEARAKPGWTPDMLIAVLDDDVNDKPSWLALQARKHTTHPDWPAIIRHAEREGYDVGEVEGVALAGAGPRKGCLVVMLKCGREIDAKGVL